MCHLPFPFKTAAPWQRAADQEGRLSMTMTHEGNKETGLMLLGPRDQIACGPDELTQARGSSRSGPWQMGLSWEKTQDLEIIEALLAR